MPLNELEPFAKYIAIGVLAVAAYLRHIWVVKSDERNKQKYLKEANDKRLLEFKIEYKEQDRKRAEAASVRATRLADLLREKLHHANPQALNDPVLDELSTNPLSTGDDDFNTTELTRTSKDED